MNTPTIFRTSKTEWLCRGIAITAALLISGAVALGLANRAAINSTLVSPAASMSAAQERYAAFKQRQAEQVADAAMALAPVPATGGTRSVAFKDTLAIGRERFAAMKQRQADQIMDAAMASVSASTVVIPAPSPSGRERFYEFKQRQADMQGK